MHDNELKFSVNDFLEIDFKEKEQYDLGIINPKEIYIQQIEFSFIGSDNYYMQELIVFRNYIYFGTKIKKNSVIINQKFPLKNIYLLENDNDIIECIIIPQRQK